MIHEPWFPFACAGALVFGFMLYIGYLMDK